MERFNLVGSTDGKGCSLDNAVMKGVFGRMKLEAVYPRTTGTTNALGGAGTRRRIHTLVKS